MSLRCRLFAIEGGKRERYNRTQDASYGPIRPQGFAARDFSRGTSDDAGEQPGTVLTACCDIGNLRLNHALAVFVFPCPIKRPEEPAAAEISLRIASAASRGLLAAVIGLPTTR